MAVLRKIALECDECNEVFDDMNYVGYSVAEVRALARAKGWSVRRRWMPYGNAMMIDLCYGCQF